MLMITRNKVGRENSIDTSWLFDEQLELSIESLNDASGSFGPALEEALFKDEKYSS